MKDQIKELRVKIDGLAKLTESLKPIKANFTTRINREGLSVTFEHNELFDGKAPAINSAQIEEAVNSLLLAKAWLGKILAEIGDTNPYAKSDGNRKSVEDIEPTADTADLSDYYMVPLSYEHKSHIEKVDWIREEIKKLSEEISLWYTHTQTPTRECNIARTNSYNYLCEARFYLGFELQRIKENG